MGKEKQMHDLKPETIAVFEKFSKEYPELIDYRIKFGNVYEKAQATLIKNVAETICKIQPRPSSLKFRKTQQWPLTIITSDPQEQIDPEMRSDPL